MEQRRIHPQQHAHRPQDPLSFDILQSPFYPTYPDNQGGESRATQPPHPSPQYSQQHYTPDSDPPLEAQRSSPRQYGLQEHLQQGRPHLGDHTPPPALQQPQPRPAAAHPLFPQRPAPQAPYPQFPHAPTLQPPQHRSIYPWPFNAFDDNTSLQAREGTTHLYDNYDFIYTHPPQQRYSFPMTQPSAAPHTPLETSPTTAVPGPSQTFREQHNNGTNADAGQRSRQWGGPGELDPTTGVYRTPDHPRIRTAQACDKCRQRKAKCSGDNPCQRCKGRGLPCVYAPERRMRGPNKPKPPPTPLPDGSQPPAAAEAQKTRRRASTMPSAPRQGSLIWGQQQQQQQKHKQNQHRHQGIVTVAAAASPASPASSAGSGSFGYPPPSESEASPMTPHSSLGSRRPSVVGFSTSPQVLVHDSSAATTRPGVLSHISGYGDDGVAAVEGMFTAGVYAQDILPDTRLSLESPKAPF